MLHASVEITYADVTPAGLSMSQNRSLWCSAHLLLSTCFTPNSSEAELIFVSVGQVQLVFLEMMLEPVLISTKGEIMNRCPIRNGFSDVCHPPGIDLQCYPEDECELLSAAIMCEMSFL